MGRGVDGIFVVCASGEFWALSIESWLNVINKRVPVYMGAGVSTTQEAIWLGELAQETGADGLSVLAPSFVILGADEMFRHYKKLAAVVELPVVLYTISDRTSLWF